MYTKTLKLTLQHYVLFKNLQTKFVFINNKNKCSMIIVSITDTISMITLTSRVLNCIFAHDLRLPQIKSLNCNIVRFLY